MEELIKLSEHIYYLKYDEVGDRPNLYYIKGKDYSVCIDAGNSKRHIEKFYDALKRNNLIDPKYTIITHWHWDHTFGLKYAKGERISSIKTYEKLQEVQKYKWTIEDLAHRLETKEEIPFCFWNIQVEYKDLNEIEVSLPDTYLEENKTLDLGDIKVELFVRDSTHSRDSIFIYVPDDKVLIVSDADCPDYYHGEVYVKDKLIDMINFFKSLDYEYHCLGHALPESKQFALDRLNDELNKLD